MIRSNILIFNTCTTFLNNNPHQKKKNITRYKNWKHVSKLMLKNAFTYSLIQYWNREHAIYLFFQGPYAVCRTHWFLYSNLYLWNFCKHEVRSFRMIISIFYCLKFFTFKCSSFCSVKRWKERKEWRNTFANACLRTLRRDLAVPLWCGPGPLSLR